MNDNSKIAVNSIVILVRLVITSLIGIFASRLVLDALGASDYGLYNVVGSIVTFLNVINGATMTENFTRLISDTNKPQIQEAQRIWLLHGMLLLIHPTLMVPLTMWADCGDDTHYS